MALLVGAVPSAASARPPTNLRVPAHPVPRRYNNRGVPWVAWYAHGDGATGGHLDRNDILAMPTVGAGSSRFSRRFPRPSSHPPCEMPAHPVPRRYSNRGYPWVAWSAHGGGNGIWIAMLSPPMPTVGAGGSRGLRRFPRPPQPPSRRASPLRIALPPSASRLSLRIALPLSASRFPLRVAPRIALTPASPLPPRIVYVIFAELLAHCLFLIVNSRYLCGVPRWWGINFIRLV